MYMFTYNSLQNLLQEGIISAVIVVQYEIYGFLTRWFHGKIAREDSETLLKPREEGLFLVRESVNYPGDYSLSVV